MYVKFSFLLFLVFQESFSNPTLSLGLMGGSPTKIENYPYHVTIFDNLIYVCGGSLVTLDIVLTVAHCVCFQNIKQTSIRAGSTLLNQEDAPKRKIIKIYIHEAFSYVDFNFDIAIVKLDFAFIASNKIQPVNLIEKNVEIESLSVSTIAGFGPTEEGGLASENILQIEIPIIPYSYCYRILPKIVRPSIICAGFTFERLKLCKSDSGGGLVVNQTLVGLALAASPCLSKFSGMSIFTSVAYFRDWIDNKIMKLT